MVKIVQKFKSNIISIVIGEVLSIITIWLAFHHTLWQPISNYAFIGSLFIFILAEMSLVSITPWNKHIEAYHFLTILACCSFFSTLAFFILSLRLGL